MGQMRFLAPRQEQVPEGAVERAYLAGMEGIPWRSRNWWTAAEEAPGPGEFVVQREVNESGNLYLPWCVNGHGELVLSTASLMERAKPYHLPLELARGTVNRVRNQAADWQGMGLQVTPELEDDFKSMSAAFSQAATSTADQEATSNWAAQAIQLALGAVDKLTATYAAQAIASRRVTSQTLPTFFAGRIDCRPLGDAQAQGFVSAFNSAQLDFQWRELEPTASKFAWEAYDRQLQWCRDQGLRVVGGPLLQLDRHHMPDWMYLWEGDFQQVLHSTVQYVRAVVERYRGKVHVWNCAARMNLDCAIKLNEEERLRLVVAVIDEVQRLDARTPYIISFDQPWAEYLSTADHDFSPLHFADSLVRAELGLAGIALEMNFGYWPQGTLARDWLEVSRQLDRWNLLGLPLLIMTTVPSATSPDPNARVQARPVSRLAKNGPSLATQQQAAERLALLALAKSFVHGFIWNETTDSMPHEFANGGLFDLQGRPKPALGTLASLRKQFLT